MLKWMKSKIEFAIQWVKDWLTPPINFAAAFEAERAAYLQFKRLNTFHIGIMKVEKDERGGFWVFPRGAGRGKYIEAGTEGARELEERRAVKVTLEKASAVQGPLVYYRGADGKIGIPPDPSMVPKGADRYEASSLRDVDRVMSELTADAKRDWEDEGEFQAGLDAIVGNPRQHLVSQLGRSISNRERDFIHEAIKDLDHEQSERQRLTISNRHRASGYDS